MIYVETPRWRGWDPYRLPGPDKDYPEGVGACLTRTFWMRDACARVYISWGPSSQHGQADTWRTRHSTDWYADLEVFAPWAADPKSGCAIHIERRFKTRRQAHRAALWLRSCIAVAGVRGIRAMAERTGGRLA